MWIHRDETPIPRACSSPSWQRRWPGMRGSSRRRRDRNVFVNLFALVLCSALAGVIVAALVFPVVAMGGLTARSGADTFDGLPTDINVLPSPQVSYAYASDGTTLLARF